jgi:predicted Zn-dependent protease
MKGGRNYDIFPRTFLPRVLLGLAFLGGSALMFGWLAVFIIGVSSLQFIEQAQCSGSDAASCLDEQTGLESLASDSCAGAERRVCLVPLGQVSAELVEHLVDYYQREYGLSISMLTPSAVPAELIDPDRGQIDVQDLMDYMATLFPGASSDPNVVLIGVTPVDMYDRTSHYRFLFGARDTEVTPRAVVSTSRLNLKIFGISEGAGALRSRARKLVTKNIGILYYGLPPKDDPESPLYNSILSTADLDDMEEPLAVPGSSQR